MDKNTNRGTITRGLQFGGDGGFPPPPGSAPPGPGAPPPSYPPSSYPPPPPPGPYAPPPGGPMPGAYLPPGAEKKGFPWGPVLIGCGVIVLIIVIISAGSCIYLMKKGGDVVSGAMGIAIAEWKNELTGDHTPEQKQRFEDLLDAVYTQEFKRLGMMQWSVTYQEVVNKLSEVSADQTITVEESAEWCDMAYYALESNGFWGEGGGGDEAPAEDSGDDDD